METHPLFWSGSDIPLDARARVCGTLNARLADGVDLVSQLRVVRWNLRGASMMRVASLLALAEFDLDRRLEQIAERVTSLGARAYGSVRFSANASRITECGSGGLDECDQVLLAVERVCRFLEGVRESRRQAEGIGDAATGAVLGAILRDFERIAFTLRTAVEAEVSAEKALSAAAG